MTILKAHFDGKVIVPDEPVDLPTGLALEVRVEPIKPPQGPKNALRKLAELAEKHPAKGLPADSAVQHDHYLHGTPKRVDP